MKFEVRDGKLFVEIDLQKPVKSSTGKTLVVASTGGAVRTSEEVGGKPVSVNLTATIPK